jgi:predicted ATPase
LVEQAAGYRYQAGQAAAARAASAEAAEQFGLGIELLESLPDSPERRRRELDLQTALGAALIAEKGYSADETGRAFARARALCEQAGDVHRLMPVLNGQMLFHYQRGAMQAAYDIASEMLALAEQRRDPALLIPAHRAMSLASISLGRPIATRAHTEQVLELFDPSRHRSLASLYAFDQRTVALGYLSAALLVLGYPDQARYRNREALIEARQLSHPASLAQALHRSCIFEERIRNADRIAEAAEAAIAISVEHGMPYFLGHGRFYRGIAWLALGNVEEALVEIEEGEAALRASGLVLRVGPGPAEIHETLARGRPSSDLAVEAVNRLNEAFGHSAPRAEEHRVAGERLLGSSEPDHEEIEAHFRQALEIAREQEAKMWELRAATSLARLWAKQGERTKAHDLLAPVYDWFTEGFDTPDLKDAKALLDQLT